MALNPNPIGKSIADYIVANRPADGTPVTTTQLETLWQGIINLLYNDIKANAEVEPGSLAITPSDIVAPGGGGACSGNGDVNTGTGTIS